MVGDRTYDAANEAEDLKGGGGGGDDVEVIDKREEYAGRYGVGDEGGRVGAQEGEANSRRGLGNRDRLDERRGVTQEDINVSCE